MRKYKLLLVENKQSMKLLREIDATLKQEKLTIPSHFD